MPLNTGGGAEAPAEEYSAPSKPKINTSTLALVAAFAAGLVLLYLLGLHNKPKVASAADMAHEKQLEDIFDKLTHNDGKQIENLLSDGAKFKKMIEDYFKPKPFNQDQVVNPFARDLPPDPIFGQGSATQKAEPLPQNDVDPAIAREMLEAAKYFETLKLQMVMYGNPSMAMINGRMVTTGAKLNMFTVGEIKPDSVSLTYKETPYVLKSSNPGSKQ